MRDFAVFDIPQLEQSPIQHINERIAQKTKPPGSLGQLELLATQLALITGPESIVLERPAMLVFAGDHGIATENISIAPMSVTRQMVQNFLDGGAAINCFCRTHGWVLEVIDAGILEPIDDERLVQQSLGCGTASFVERVAMSDAKVQDGLALGARVVRSHLAKGTNLFGFGEMGIGNTSSAAALMAVLTGLPVEHCVGRGTGISDSQYQLKLNLIQRALQQHNLNSAQTLEALAAFGGFEIVQMVGAMLSAAEGKSILLVDGFISTVAALVAIRLNQNVRDYMVFCHQSAESGHQKLLELLKAIPLLSFGLRLGEGTGAAIALPILQATQSFYNDMATFEKAGVSAV